MKLGTGSSTDLDLSVFGLIILPGSCSGIMQLSPQILKEEIKLDQHPSPSNLHPPLPPFFHTHTHKPVFLPLSVATRAEDVGQLPRLPSSLAVPPPAVFPGPLAAYHTDVEHHLHHAVEPRGQQKKEEEEEGEEEGRRRKKERRKKRMAVEQLETKHTVCIVPCIYPTGLPGPAFVQRGHWPRQPASDWQSVALSPAP